MDPAIAHRDFRPPPQPGLSLGLLLAIIVHVVLIAALAWGVRWKLGGSDAIAPAPLEQTASVPFPELPAASSLAEPVPSPPQERQPSPERPRQAAPQILADGKNAKARNAVVASAPQRAASPKPSFDCGKARSFAERTICSDAELAQLDRDLGRLHARAKRAADNPAAFRRQNDAEWRRREKTCRDRSCLVRWYADRRQQLTESLKQASLRTDRTASR